MENPAQGTHLHPSILGDRCLHTWSCQSMVLFSLHPSFWSALNLVHFSKSRTIFRIFRYKGFPPEFLPKNFWKSKIYKHIIVSLMFMFHFLSKEFMYLVMLIGIRQKFLSWNFTCTRFKMRRPDSWTKGLTSCVIHNSHMHEQASVLVTQTSTASINGDFCHVIRVTGLYDVIDFVCLVKRRDSLATHKISMTS